MADLFFTSDPHFNHNNIIRLCDRPFANTEEMNEKLIENWNQIVGPKDTIYCLGDFGWQLSPQILQEIGSRLNGHKHLIVGNHDKSKLHIKSQMWESVDYYTHINYNKRRLILFHYPIYDFDGAFHKSILLYGHLHSKETVREVNEIHNKKGFLSYCVGVDLNDYKPISFDEILQKINA